MAPPPPHDDDAPTPQIAPLVAAKGFREYDARWRWGAEIDAAGMRAVGLGLGTLAHELGIAAPRVVVGHDFRAYSPEVKAALVEGLVASGCEVLDIGLSLSPMAYFAQFDLGAPCVAMVTASHNPNGWTGVKMGASPPLTFGPEEMARLKAIVLDGRGVAWPGGRLVRVEGVRERYLVDVVGGRPLERRLRVVVACGNGTAGVFAPEAVSRMSADVVPLDCDLDANFPRHNPDPDSAAMQAAMSQAVLREGADLALGFDGDGDRCGVTDETGATVMADKMGLLLARDLAARHPGARFVVDVKSTGLYAADPVLAANGASVIYWKTGHSHIKRKMAEIGALAGFEKSGHVFLGPPLGRGYDDALGAAGLVLSLLDRSPGRTLSQRLGELPVAYTSPALSVPCADEAKYAVVEAVTAAYLGAAQRGERVLGREIAEVATLDGARVRLDDGAWLLVRASSNTPEIVVVVESLASAEDMAALFRDEVKPRLAAFPEVGAFVREV